MVPGRVDMAEHIVQISAGDSHTAFLSDDGRVFACGTFRVSTRLVLCFMVHGLHQESQKTKQMNL